MIFSQFTVKTSQSWSNLSRGEIQPSGLVSVLLSSGKAHLPTSTSENHLSLAELWQSSAKLSRNYRGTIKTLATDLSAMDIYYIKVKEGKEQVYHKGHF